MVAVSMQGNPMGCAGEVCPGAMTASTPSLAQCLRTSSASNVRRAFRPHSWKAVPEVSSAVRAGATSGEEKRETRGRRRRFSQRGVAKML